MENIQVYKHGVVSSSSIPKSAGNYIFALSRGCSLPRIEVAYQTKKISYKQFSFEVVYTGISNDLYDRLIKTHFGGNAGRSTLRKSIGSLLGFKKIPRDKVENGKTKFSDSDEMKITEWMSKNLIVFYFVNPECEEDEIRLINEYNPPLNLDKNSNEINKEYRNMLSQLRSKGKIEISPLEHFEKMMKRDIPMFLKGTLDGRPHKTVGKYTNLWNRYKNDIKALLIDEGACAKEIQLTLEELESGGGNRQKYSFRIEMYNGSTNSLSGSAVARDLYNVLIHDDELFELQKTRRLVVRMGKDLCIKAYIE